MGSFCVTFSILLALWPIPDLHIPLDVQLPDNVSVGTFVCSNITLAPVQLDYNDSNVVISSRNASLIQCVANVTSNGTKSSLYVDLEVPSGGAVVIATNHTACLTTSAGLQQCSLTPRIVQMYLLPQTQNDAMFFALLEDVINAAVSFFICDVVAQHLMTQLMNHSEMPLLPTPAKPPSSSAIDDFLLFRALINAANGIPVVSGVRLNAHLNSAGNALALNITADQGLTIRQVDNVPYLRSVIALQLPPGVSISVDIVINGLSCMNENDCTISPCGVELLNLRLHGAGELNSLVTDTLGALATDIVNALLDPNDAPSTAPVCLNKSVTLTQPSKVVHKEMNVVAAGCVGTGFLVLSGITSWYYWTRKAAVRQFSIQRKREDVFFIFMGYIAAFGFIWASTSTSAEVILGEDIVLYSFTLEVIRDLWLAGLKALSVLVAITSGALPYIKLAVLVYVGIVFDHPNHPAVFVVDVLGKFTYLDRFALMITMTRLQVAGIADVKLLPSFYIFVSALFVSTAIGNRIVHRSRNLLSYTRLVDEKEVDGRRQQLIRVVTCCILVAAGTASCLLYCVEYEISGVLNHITGEKKFYTVLDLCSAAPLVLAATAVFTVIVAPILLGTGYSFHFAGWCATDTFFIACVAGLPQLEDFVAYIISNKALNTMYTAKAKLMWPVMFLAVSSVAMWTIIARQWCNRQRELFQGHEEAPQDTLQHDTLSP